MARKTPTYIAAFIRRVIKDGGSAPHSVEVQRFFKEEVASRGWYTDELRKLAVRFRRQMVNDYGMDFALEVGDKLFRGCVPEDKIFAVLMLQGQTESFGATEFKLFASWLDRVSSWADHDGLVHYLIGPMILDEPARSKVVLRWAKSRNRWHRRAAAVALIHSARKRTGFKQVMKVSNALLRDNDDMVQKGLGWLLREVRHGWCCEPHVRSCLRLSERGFWVRAKPERQRRGLSFKSPRSPNSSQIWAPATPTRIPPIDGGSGKSTNPLTSGSDKSRQPNLHLN